MTSKVRKKVKKSGKYFDLSEYLSDEDSIAVHLTIEEKNELIIENRERARKLACSIMRKWNSRIELQELESVVDLSLCESVKYFDPGKGVQFITFFYYYLRGNLIRTIKNITSKQSVPLEFCDENFESGLIGNQRINPAEAAEVLGTLDAGPELRMEHTQDYELAREACKKLTNIEKQIIFSIYLQEEQVTKLAKELNYSRCHVSRMKTTAIKKLRKEMEKSTGEKASEADLKTERRKLKTGTHRVRKSNKFSEEMAVKAA